MTALPPWGGRKAQAWSRAVLARSGPVCQLRIPGVCTVVATCADHIIPRSKRPDLQYDVTNGRSACGPCNSSRNDGSRVVAGVVDARSFFETSDSTRTGSLPSSPPGHQKNGPDAAGLIRFGTESDR